MNRSAARHLWTLLVVALLSLGCVLSNRRYSGNYDPPFEDHPLNAAHQGEAPFVPQGLNDAAGERPMIRRLAIAELGEQTVPESAVKALRGPKKSPRDVVVLPGIAFERPKPEVFDRQIHSMWNNALMQAATQMATTRPSATQPITVHVEVKFDPEAYKRISAEYDRDYRQAMRTQSAAEVARLIAEARKQEADALILVTNFRTAEQFTPTIFTWLDLLILPIFVLPTETADGRAAANGWLIDPQTGRVIKVATWDHNYRRYSPLAFTESNSERLQADQHEDAVVEVAKKLFE